MGFHPDLVVHREAGMFPLAHARGELRIEAGFIVEKVQDAEAAGGAGIGLAPAACPPRFRRELRNDMIGPMTEY